MWPTQNIAHTCCICVYNILLWSDWYERKYKHFAVEFYVWSKFHEWNRHQQAGWSVKPFGTKVPNVQSHKQDMALLNWYELGTGM